jgi:hypothetical protein
VGSTSHIDGDRRPKSGTCTAHAGLRRASAIIISIITASTSIMNWPHPPLAKRPIQGGACRGSPAAIQSGTCRGTPKAQVPLEDE